MYLYSFLNHFNNEWETKLLYEWICHIYEEIGCGEYTLRFFSLRLVCVVKERNRNLGRERELADYLNT